MKMQTIWILESIEDGARPEPKYFMCWHNFENYRLLVLQA